MSAPPTERIRWIARCIARIQCQYRSGALLPSGAPLTYETYVRLVQRVLIEYRED